MMEPKGAKKAGAGGSVKEQIIMKVKEVVERVIHAEYIAKLDPEAANTISGHIQAKHKVNFNARQASL